LLQRRSHIDFLGEPLSFKEAPEPTNIIWENRHLGFIQRTIRKFIVLCLVGLFLAGTVVIFFFLKKATINNLLKYPPSFDCSEIDSLFKTNQTLYQQAATFDKDPTLNYNGVGVYQCYCSSVGSSNSICSNYKSDLFGGTILTSLVSLLTVVINIILRTVNIKLINMIGYHTESGQTQAIMKAIFFS